MTSRPAVETASENAERHAIPPERRERVMLDIVHQKFDNAESYGKRDNETDDERHRLF